MNEEFLAWALIGCVEQKSRGLKNEFAVLSLENSVSIDPFKNMF
jgi:hypothetical protein